MAGYFGNGRTPDGESVGLLTAVTEGTDSEFGQYDTPAIETLDHFAQEEVNENDHVGEGEINPFILSDDIKIEPETDDEGCPCAKTEPESYYNCEPDDNTLCKEESGIGNDMICKQESGIADDVVKKEPVFEHVDFMSSVDRLVEG